MYGGGENTFNVQQHLYLAAGCAVLCVLVVPVEQLAPAQLAEAVAERVNRWGVGVHRAPACLLCQPPPPRHDSPEYKSKDRLRKRSTQSNLPSPYLVDIVSCEAYACALSGSLAQVICWSCWSNAILEGAWSCWSDAIVEEA